MENLVELLIAGVAFGLVGSYLSIVSRFIRESEQATPEWASPVERSSASSASAMGHTAAHAH